MSNESSRGLLTTCLPTGCAVCRRLERLVFPPICPACNQDIIDESSAIGFCSACSRQLQYMPSPRCRACGGVVDGILEVCGECAANPCRSWDHAVSVYQYGGRIRHLIHRFKYRRATALAPAFAEAMAFNFEKHSVTLPDAIVPVPMHWRRRFFRGYNQADILAGMVGTKLGIPVLKTLARRKNNRRQATLDLESRRRNVQQVFYANGKTNLQGTHIVLVDDILTTGATLDAAATALKNAGTAVVEVLTLARG